MNLNIKIKEEPINLELHFETEDAEISVYTSQDEFKRLYNIPTSSISFDTLKLILNDNKLNFIKRFKFDSDVEEWSNTEKTLLFKRENGLIIAVDKEDANRFVYLKVYDLRSYNTFDLDKRTFEVMLKNQEKKIEEQKVIAQNLDLNKWDLGIPYEKK